MSILFVTWFIASCLRRSKCREQKLACTRVYYLLCKKLANVSATAGNFKRCKYYNTCIYIYSEKIRRPWISLEKWHARWQSKFTPDRHESWFGSFRRRLDLRTPRRDDLQLRLFGTRMPTMGPRDAITYLTIGRALRSWTAFLNVARFRIANHLIQRTLDIDVRCLSSIIA